MEKKGILPTVIGLVVGLGVLYLTVRVASAGWKGGQKQM
jgi:hypothetical protein